MRAGPGHVRCSDSPSRRSTWERSGFESPAAFVAYSFNWQDAPTLLLATVVCSPLRCGPGRWRSDS